MFLAESMQIGKNPRLTFLLYFLCEAFANIRRFDKTCCYNDAFALTFCSTRHAFIGTKTLFRFCLLAFIIDSAICN